MSKSLSDPASTTEPGTDLLAPDEFVQQSIAAVPVVSDNDIRALTREFSDTLKQYDEERNDGASLWNVWEACQKMHDENASIRANMKQLQVILQNEMNNWARDESELRRGVKECKPGTEKWLENRSALMGLRERQLATIDKLQRRIIEGAKEIRASEMQSRLWYHVNTIQRFMAAMDAIHFQELQGNPERLRRISEKMHRMAALFDRQLAESTV